MRQIRNTNAPKIHPWLASSFVVTLFLHMHLQGDLLLTEPHVFEPSVQPVARLRFVVADARRPYLNARPPQAHDLPGLLDDAFLHVFH